jgi:hypothetical protein
MLVLDHLRSDIFLVVKKKVAVATQNDSSSKPVTAPETNVIYVDRTFQFLKS